MSGEVSPSVPTVSSDQSIARLLLAKEAVTGDLSGPAGPDRPLAADAEGVLQADIMPETGYTEDDFSGLEHHVDEFYEPLPEHCQTPEDPKQKTLTPEELELVSRFQYLVKPMARKILLLFGLSDNEEFNDSIGDGYVGLVKGATQYQAARVAADASTSKNFFVINIRGEILKGMRARYGRVEEPIYNEARVVVGKSDKIRSVKPSVVSGSAKSIDEMISDHDDDGFTLADKLPDDRYEIDPSSFDLAAELKELFQDCRPMDRDVVFRRIFYGETQSEIGERLGLSQMTVSRTLTRVLKPYIAKMSPLASELDT
ncbi:MAG TPA: sigma-70 family RNA polymerase sigma factor [Candidatus Dormibacteraeota bacterium]|nr:sigma-70 family RNA polymerase sigma factor [Candidatus Dormibacteraeota bacterium]